MVFSNVMVSKRFILLENVWLYLKKVIQNLRILLMWNITFYYTDSYDNS